MSATPPQGIDRDEVIALVEQLGLEVAAIVRGLGPPLLDPVIWADRILALVRPVEGVILTPEEVHTVIAWQQIALGEGAAGGPSSRALARRLEAAL